jgi:hypothetical protein
LRIALAVARGDDKVVFSARELMEPVEPFEPDVPGLDDLVWTANHYRQAGEVYKKLMELQRDFPMIALELAEADVLEDGQAAIDMESAGPASDDSDLFKMRIAPTVPTVPLPAAQGTLFAAMDAFGAIQKQMYTETEHGKKQAERLDFLKRHLTDCPLATFNNEAIDRVRTIIKGRPLTKRGRPCSVDFAKSLVKILNAFVDWLDGSSLGWAKPRGYRVKPVKIRRTMGENATRHRKPVYTRGQLITLYQYATPLERVCLLLALNCAFGAGELATLWIEEIRLDHEHEEYGKVGNWIMRDRHKSSAYGEWRLWIETVAGIKWYRQRHNKKDTGPLLLVGGEPITFTEGGNRSQYFASMMTRLVTRIRKDQPDFPRLSFNKLKKTSSTLVRRLASAEVASLHTSHGEVCDDPLLSCYANADFRPVFKAQRRLRKYLTPMFEVVPDPFPAEAKRHNPSISLAMIRKIKEMRAKKIPYKTICQELGVSMDTVRRYRQ